MTKQILVNYKGECVSRRLNNDLAQTLETWLRELIEHGRGYCRSFLPDHLFVAEQGRHDDWRSTIITFRLPQTQDDNVLFLAETSPVRFVITRRRITVEIAGQGAKAWNQLFKKLDPLLMYRKLRGL